MKPKPKATPVVEEKKETVKESKKKMLKKEWSRDDWRQAFVNYAYQIWWEDLVYLIECENATWNMYRQSEVYNKWRREPSYWFCQIDRDFYESIVDSDKFWADPFWQLDKCNELMKGWTPFYWRESDRDRDGVKCYVEVQNRFYFE